MKRLLFLLFGICLLGACHKEPSMTVVLPDGFTVQARIADTPEKHEKGLMFVTKLPENEGMLFVFDQESKLTFWMKNTLIDLDMVFIGADRHVTSVADQMPHSFTYTPDYEIAYATGYGKYVLELAAKTAQRHGVTSGSKIQFSQVDPK